MNQNELNILKELVESFGPAGFERETTNIVKKHVNEFADEIKTDKLGSVMFKLNGNAEKPVIMIPGHVDEVGFIISGIDKSGFLTFNPLGGWFDQVLLAQRVTVRTHKGDFMGVVATKPPHLLGPDEKSKVVTKDKMFIDCGFSSKDEAEAEGFRIGDPVVPISHFSLIQNGKLAMGKAFDDRIGAFAAMIALKRIKEQGIDHPNTVVGVATTQEEVGLRGARTAAHVVNPDVSLVCEVDISGDVPGIKVQEAPTKMGKGVSIVTYDGSLIPPQALKDFVIKVAEETKIPYQLSSISGGGTDGGVIHMTRSGVPSIVLGVSTRHIHSHVGILSIKDVEHLVNLLIEIIKRMDKETVENFSN